MDGIVEEGDIAAALLRLQEAYEIALLRNERFLAYMISMAILAAADAVKGGARRSAKRRMN